ncbi:hypothetical protein E2C01_050245 [Portunus trituberculatus]|uniref:Uncharacterized protein n=1 Tax=Portunus trituberculatus TaxID=210409 RepID=A0A5B7GBJ8_PORTR|nr:hypothetical protein [Portunus trituberculatus]
MRARQAVAGSGRLRPQEGLVDKSFFVSLREACNSQLTFGGVSWWRVGRRQQWQQQVEQRGGGGGGGSSGPPCQVKGCGGGVIAPSSVPLTALTLPRSRSLSGRLLMRSLAHSLTRFSLACSATHALT